MPDHDKPKGGDRDPVTGQFRPGNTTGAQWQPGVGPVPNPRGKSKLRRQFEDTFFEALATGGSPEEAAALLWQAARKLEPWALTLLLQKLCPTPTEIRLKQEVNQNGPDLSKLSDDDLRQLEAILGRCEPVAELASGTLPPELSDVH
jgi:hypothetical protein